MTDDVYYLEALRDLAPLGFVRIHRNHAVNPGRVLEIRATSGSLWEVRLEPPVNVVLAISRGSLPSLLAAYREAVGEPHGRSGLAERGPGGPAKVLIARAI